MTTKAYSYVRVSSIGQADGHGPERQREAIAAYASSHGYDLIHEFADLGVSGTNDIDNRPGLWAMIQAIIGNGVRAVLVERMDRLARDLYVSEKIINELRKHGIKLVSVIEGEDMTSQTDPSRELVRQIMGAVAGYDKKMIVSKLRVAREAKKRQTGKCEGRKAYGEVSEEERQIVKRVRELRRKRPGKAPLGATRIANILNAEGFVSRKGLPFTIGVVKAILKCKTYQSLGKRGTEKK